MNVVCVKLITGLELVGELEGFVDDDYLNLVDPLAINQGFDPDGTMTLMFFPFMPYSQEKLFTFNRKDVMVYCIPNEQLASQYLDYRSRTDPDPSMIDELLEAIRDGETIH